jgi:hypothetical protein
LSAGGSACAAHPINGFCCSMRLASHATNLTENSRANTGNVRKAFCSPAISRTAARHREECLMTGKNNPDDFSKRRFAEFIGARIDALRNEQTKRCQSEKNGEEGKVCASVFQTRDPSRDVRDDPDGRPRRA